MPETRTPAGGEPREGGGWEASPLDLYLDGALEGEALRGFEERLGRDGALRAEVESARRADRWLRDRFGPPAEMPPGLLRPAAPAAIPISGGPARRPRWMPWALGIAAVLAVIVGVQYTGLLGGNSGGGPSGQGPQSARGDAAGLFRSIEAAGFTPVWVCSTDEELRKYTRENLGAAWTIAPVPGLELVGWSYTDRLLNGQYSSVLLATYNGRRLIVVADHAHFDRKVNAPADGSLKVHKRTIGETVVYEVSPLDEPVVLGRISAAE